MSNWPTLGAVASAPRRTPEDEEGVVDDEEAVEGLVFLSVSSSSSRRLIGDLASLRPLRICLPLGDETDFPSFP